MLPERRRRLQPTVGSGGETAARQPPAFLPPDLRAEWDAVSRGHHNFLLVGSPSATSEMFAAMAPRLRAPIQRYRPKPGLSVPAPVEGTLVVLEAARLDGEQQRQLLRWLQQFDRRPHVQVVSTTAKPLFSLVETGQFLADLYYKLNVVRVDLIGSESVSRGARSRLD
jgi:transcriptional regulator of aromatic amino acid metabolism